MQQTPSDVGQWDLIRMQVSQSLVEHEIVAQALRAQSIVSALFVLALGCLCFSLWRRHAYLNEAFHAEIRRHCVERCALVKQHSSERVAMLKQHSLEHSSTQMQMLHHFEGIVTKRRASSGSSLISSEPPPIRRTPKPT